MSDFTIGVEEEFHLVDPQTRRLRPAVAAVLERGRRRLGEDVDAELLPSQVEVRTPVCSSLAEVRTAVVRLRHELGQAAAEAGCRLAASGTHPWQAQVPEVTRKQRYEEMADRFGIIAREQVVCGCHVHVGIADPEIAISAMNRARPWLATLLALSANSPFWCGEDTGYASFRTQVWSHWPSAGPPGFFASREEYDEVMAALVDVGVLRDLGMLYWDVRPAQELDTLEFRVADACLSVDESVMLAGLTRALARTCTEAASRDEPVEHVGVELLRAAHWRAARSGLDGDLVDVDARRPVPAGEQVRRLLDHVGPALAEHGDVAEVTALVAQTLGRGTGAARQRAAYQRRGNLDDVVDLIVRESSQ